MPLDRRLRDGLDRLAGEIEPDVEGRLKATLGHAGRRNLVQRSLPILAATTALVLVAIVGPAMVDLWRGEAGPPIGASQAPSPSPSALAGAFTASVESDDLVVQESNLGGSWTVEFDASGILVVTSPASYAGTRTGYSYQVTGDELRTDLFGEDVCSTLLPGRYRWERTGDIVTFSTIDEPCAGRAAFFAGQPWRATTAE